MGSKWAWAASGKHPVAKDYFTVGAAGDPMVRAFNDWTEKGYQRLSSRRDEIAFRDCSWRFWARGPQKDSLVCGVVKESGDSVGRRYPLLVVGTGFLPGWTDYWDLLPFACETPWGQMEFLSSRRYDDFRQLEEDVERISAPSQHWSEMKVEQDGILMETENRAIETWEAGAAAPVFLASLKAPQGADAVSITGAWHCLLKKAMPSVPNAVFMGGTADKSYLAVFRRALNADDFVALWSGAVDRFSDVFLPGVGKKDTGTPGG